MHRLFRRYIASNIGEFVSLFNKIRKNSQIFHIFLNYLQKICKSSFNTVYTAPTLEYAAFSYSFYHTTNGNSRHSSELSLKMHMTAEKSDDE